MQKKFKDTKVSQIQKKVFSESTSITTNRKRIFKCKKVSLQP